MHPYSTDSEERSQVPFFVALISILFARLIAIALKKFQLPFWFEVPGAFSIYGLFLAAFRRYLWRWRLFRALGVVKVPDLRGKWQGSAISSFDKSDQYEVLVEIHQNWTHMAIRLVSGGSFSHSVVASIYVGDDGTTLSYQFQNEPNVHATPTMHAHNGTASLRLADNQSHLEGDYYTGRDRRNHGSISLRRCPLGNPIVPTKT